MALHFKNSMLFFILGSPVLGLAQHSTIHSDRLWAGYFNTISFNKKWSLKNDAQLRTTDWFNKWSQLLIRSGAVYNFNNRVAVTVGLAFFKNAQYSGKELLLKNEWRPWQEFSYELPFHKINFSQRLRTEQRFLQLVQNNELSKSYQYIFRLRYKFEWQFPLKDDNIKLLTGNEIMVNPGYIRNSLFFDQNRTSAGINFKLNSTSNLQCQYLKIFQWHSNTSVLEDQNVFRINFIQQFNRFKKS